MDEGTKKDFKRELYFEIKKVIKDANPSLSNKDIKEVLVKFLVKL